MFNLDFWSIPVVVPGTSAATAGNYGTFFVAPFPCEVYEAWETHKTAGTDPGAVTLAVEKLTPGQALGAGVEVLSTTFNLKSTADECTRVKASTTTTSRFLNPGDRLALKDTGTLTAVEHVVVTVLVRIVTRRVSATDNP